MADAEDDGGGSMGSGRARELLINGLSMDAAEVEAKLDEGNIQEAETSLREGLSLNYEEARALLGRLEYQRGNVEAALRVFDGVDLQAAIQRLQPSPEKPPSRRSRSHGESLHAAPQHAATLVLEAIFLKSMSLQKLGMATEAAEQCKSVLDAAEKLFQNGPDTLLDNKLQETISKAVEFLPELWKQAGQDNEVLVSYRRALLNQWNIDEECCARIQKRYAVFLLYSGVETGPPNSATQADGSLIPKNNFEEAVLLLMILLRKWLLGKIQRDPSVMEHFTFALSLCGQTNVLARHFEEVLPGVYPRCDRWYSLALCYSAAGDNKAALNLLRKSLNKHESPNDIPALLLAAKICSEDCYLASEGVEHARKAVANAHGGVDEHLKSVGLHLLGTCLGKQAKVASSDQERSHLRTEALKSLDEAITVEQDNPDLIFDLGLEYAEQHNMNAALRCAKGFIDATGGSLLKGWRFLALVLSSQQRYSEAEVVTDAAFDETSKWEQGPLLRIKAKLKAAQSLPMDAVEAYRFLLALVQAQRKTAGSLKSSTQVKDDKADEFEVWQGLGNLYSSLSHWRDAEICLEKARALKPYSAATLHTEGFIREAQGQSQEALGIYSNALSTDPDHVLCKVSLGALLWKRGSKSLPVARCFLSDALRLEPTNRLAWYYLGMVHRDDGRIAEAADCFQAASMLEESDPIESFILIS